MSTSTLFIRIPDILLHYAICNKKIEFCNFKHFKVIVCKYLVKIDLSEVFILSCFKLLKAIHNNRDSYNKNIIKMFYLRTVGQYVLIFRERQYKKL